MSMSSSRSESETARSKYAHCQFIHQTKRSEALTELADLAPQEDSLGALHLRSSHCQLSIPPSDRGTVFGRDCGAVGLTSDAWRHLAPDGTGPSRVHQSAVRVPSRP